jgi:hypothetical protein
MCSSPSFSFLFETNVQQSISSPLKEEWKMMTQLASLLNQSVNLTAPEYKADGTGYRN